MKASGGVAMFSVRHECPHCANQVDFHVGHIAQYNIRNPHEAVPAISVTQCEPGELTDAYGTAACPLCHAPVMILFQAAWQDIGEIIKCGNDRNRLFRKTPPTITGIYPEKKQARMHASYPAEIQELFKLVQEMLHRDELPAAIVSMCGSVLEVSLKELGAKGKRFVDMIDDCHHQGMITSPIRDWFHHLRLERNQATHEIKASRKQAEEIVAFLIFFLEMAFVIPDEIMEKQKQ